MLNLEKGVYSFERIFELEKEDSELFSSLWPVTSYCQQCQTKVCEAYQKEAYLEKIQLSVHHFAANLWSRNKILFLNEYPRPDVKSLNTTLIPSCS